MLFQRLTAAVRSWSTRRRAVTSAACGGVLVAGLVVGLLVASGSPAPAKPSAASSTSSTAKAAHVAAHPKPARRRHPAPKPLILTTCPLTGVKPPGGKIPQREVLAVKVGNNPTARPQSGLQDADIVYDTPVEGGITRYIAVYQCGNAGTVGPVRSVRWDDWHVLAQFGHAALAFVGGVIPNQDTVASLPWICNLNDFVHPELYYQSPARVRPDATYTSTATLRSVCGKALAPPPAFQFSAGVQPGSAPVASTEINYSGEADVVWEWSTPHHAFLHGYREGGVVVPDIDSDGQQIQAHNVLIQVVGIEYGPYAESPGSTGDLEAQVLGHGPAYLLRNGRELTGSWARGHWDDMTTFTTTKGKQFLLDPGNTWVELVPVGIPVTVTR